MSQQSNGMGFEPVGEGGGEEGGFDKSMNGQERKNFKKWWDKVVILIANILPCGSGLRRSMFMSTDSMQKGLCIFNHIRQFRVWENQKNFANHFLTIISLE
jgi:hypothetical protein